MASEKTPNSCMCYTNCTGLCFIMYLKHNSNTNKGMFLVLVGSGRTDTPGLHCVRFHSGMLCEQKSDLTAEEMYDSDVQTALTYVSRGFQRVKNNVDA